MVSNININLRRNRLICIFPDKQNNKTKHCHNEDPQKENSQEFIITQNTRFILPSDRILIIFTHSRLIFKNITNSAQNQFRPYVFFHHFIIDKYRGYEINVRILISVSITFEKVIFRVKGIALPFKTFIYAIKNGLMYLLGKVYFLPYQVITMCSRRNLVA